MTEPATAAERIKSLETRLGYEPTSRNHLTVETRLETLEWKTGSRIRRQTATKERLEILERNVAKMRKGAPPLSGSSDNAAVGPVASRTRQADSNERLNQADGSGRTRAPSPQPKRPRSREKVSAAESSPQASAVDGPPPKRTRSREKMHQAAAEAAASSSSVSSDAPEQPPKRTRSRDKVQEAAEQERDAGGGLPKTRSEEKLSRSQNQLSDLEPAENISRSRPPSRSSNRSNSTSPNSRAARTSLEPPLPLAPPPGLSVQNALQLARTRKKATQDHDAAANVS